MKPVFKGKGGFPNVVISALRRRRHKKPQQSPFWPRIPLLCECEGQA
jgi:hypothetical protein